MKEKLFIFGALGLLVALLVGLNAASYVQKEKIPDSEANPNRSTYNTGPTGTRAFHDLLVGTGHRVRRWEKPISDLNMDDTSEINTFVIVGKTRKEIQDDEISQLLEWVEYGGRLVIIDRRPPLSLIKTSTAWTVKIEDVDDAFSAGELEVLLPTVDPANSTQMTDGEAAARSLQASLFSAGVNAVQPSKFATSVLIKRGADTIVSPTEPPPAIGTAESIDIDKNPDPGGDETDVPSADSDVVRPPESITVKPTGTPEGGFIVEQTEPAPASEVPTDRPITVQADSGGSEIDYSKIAPVIHFGNEKKKILVDFPYGYGSIVVLSDPYVVSNGGISLVDNAQMAINVVGGYGVVVFDEYHQGFGSNQNRLITYFYGTPVVPVFLQLLLLVGLLMLSLSRRFARPLPLIEPSRLTKLEYVAAMAQLKRSTKAYDLAVENIYTDFRRRVSRLTGLDNLHAQNRELADAIELRTDYTASEVLGVMSKCEDIMHGEATNKRIVLALAVKIREIEKALGLRRGRTMFRK